MAPDGVPLTVEEQAVRKDGRKALDDAALSLEHELGDGPGLVDLAQSDRRPVRRPDRRADHGRLLDPPPGPEG